VLAEPLTAPGKPTESAAELFARKFGRQAAENLLGPLFGGTYGSDPARMPARHALSGLIALEAREGSLLKPALRRIVFGESPPPISFARGLQELPRSLYETHADRIHLGTPVTAIGESGTRTDRGDEGEGRFVLATPEGEQRVDRVAVTVDARTAAGLFDSVGARGLEGLGSLRYNPLAVVHLDSDYSGRGFGYQIRWEESAKTLGVTWNASLFDREGIYTAFLGGMKTPGILDRDDEELGEVAAREFEAVLGHDAEVLSVRRWEQGFPAYDRSWDALEDLKLPEGIDLLTNYTARAGVSSRIGQAKELAGEVADEREREETTIEPPTAE
jgi:oxygen-dependent protoporphyrinogen oxidase